MTFKFSNIWDSDHFDSFLGHNLLHMVYSSPPPRPLHTHFGKQIEARGSQYKEALSCMAQHGKEAEIN